MSETPPSTVPSDRRVRLPYRSLRDMVPFLEEGSLTTIAGPTGEGKTTFALDLVRHTAAAGQRTLYLHSSQSEDGIRVRLLAAEAEVSNTQIRTNDLDPQGQQRLDEARQTVETWPLDLRHRSVWTLEGIENDSRRNDYDLIVIDDTDQISLPGVPLSERFSHISAGLREIVAGESSVLVTVTQLDPPNESTGGFSDEEKLRRLGHRYPLAQDSSLVVATGLNASPFRPERGLTLSMHVAKNRHGATGRAEAKAEMHFCRCVDFTDEENSSDPWQQSVLG
ncbi:DnaB-like helicase C-terminal domain-containing protein [Nocardiopsis tropica]|uniref:DnaB-like helicase C-terminal domain-containing protein n=1 Tax=Nocardiopsis tropica TaxID=109330 RepID=A0ABU7KL16_9ACTN|nr:DnaB-like helicase C-terminal domain-containing protein [Nocardiopsis umidischolae]MEE2049709.1 DnaB-like helicase C-terminal domain-containing protein [Nocardiopsis umidischolae]